jgi:lysozyme
MTVWSQDEADIRLARDIVERERIAEAAITSAVTQGQFDAFVSILFNVGQGGAGRDGVIRLSNGKPSTLLRKINAGDMQGAALEFPKWCKANGMTILGLRRRRAAEQALFQGLDSHQAIKIGASIQ